MSKRVSLTSLNKEKALRMFYQYNKTYTHMLNSPKKFIQGHTKRFIAVIITERRSSTLTFFTFFYMV